MSSRQCKEEFMKETLRFIKNYRESPLLWNPAHKHYCNKTARMAAMKALGKKHNLTTEGLKNKIKCIRSYYIKERRKVIMKSLDDGVIHEPKWFAYNEMQFLSNIVSKDEEVVQDAEENDYITLSDEGEGAEEIGIDSADDSRSSSDNPAKKFKYEVLPEPEFLDANVETIPDNDYSGPFTSNETNERDDFDIFGEHIAAQLKVLPLPYALEIQEHIQKYLNKCRLDHYRSSQP